MNRMLVALALVLTCLVSLAGEEKPYSGTARMNRSKVERMFQEMRDVKGWDLTRPMLWRYYFMDMRRDRLEKLGEKLQELGYRRIRIVHDADEPVFCMTVEKIEVHTVDSLLERNHELNALTVAVEVDAYYGMDAVPVEQ